MYVNQSSNWACTKTRNTGTPPEHLRNTLLKLTLTTKNTNP